MSNMKQLAGGVTLIASIAILDAYIVVESVQDFENMVLLESGIFKMGSNKGLADESPVHEVSLDTFWIDKYEVRNADYEKFIIATGYLTESEKQGGGLVFATPLENQAMSQNHGDWWNRVIKASWKQPTAAEDSIANKTDHPVVQVSYADALAYCDWLDKELPTEAQFEFAARGGREGEMYSWGDSPLHHGQAVTNYWQTNANPDSATADGYAGTAPVGSFPPNDRELYNISGKVWEWVSDWYHPDYYSTSERENPRGMKLAEITDSGDTQEAMKSIRGGSFLCSDDYCSGFRVSARMPVDLESSTNHTGFRCVKNVK